MPKETRGNDHWIPLFCERLEDRYLLSAPVIIDSGYDFERNPHKLWLQFNQDVSASLGTADVRVDLVSSDDPGPSLASWAWDPATQKATFSFTGILPDGNYRAVVAAEDVENGSDEHLAIDHILDFFFFKADMVGPNGGPRDRTVSLPDWNRLAANMGQSDRTYSQGDLNYDTQVNLHDFNVLAGKFGANLAAPPTAPDQLVLSTLSDTEIRLNWIEYAVGEEGYRVQWSMDGAVFTTLENIQANSDFYLADGLAEGARYWFRVRAYGNGADTAYTPKVAETTVLLAPSDLRVVTYVANQRKLTWTDNSEAENEFIVERSADGIVFTEIGRAPENAASFIDEDPPPGILHSYRVRATNTRTDSSPSNETSVVGDQEESLGRPGTQATTFGNDGVWSQQLGYHIQDIEEQSTGHLIALVNDLSSYPFLIRLSRYGARDMSFGVGGIASIQTTYGLPRGIAIQPDDKIVFCGTSYASPQRLLLARFLPNGQPDLSFSGGYVQHDFGFVGARGYGVKLQPDDGKIVAHGYVFAQEFTPPTYAVVARFNQNGSIDSGFGNQGRVYTNFASSGFNQASFSDVAIDPDNRIVAVGGVTTGTYLHQNYEEGIAVARFTASGTPDATFGTAGERVYHFSQSAESAASVTVQNDGKILVGGKYTGDFQSARGVIFRLTDSGALDPNFADGGKKIEQVSIKNVSDLDLQTDGKIVASFVGTLGVVRYTISGQRDQTFGDGGIAMAGQTNLAEALDVLHDGGIVVAGLMWTPTRPAVARFVGQAKINLVAHRTGGKLFEQLSDEVENSGDPTKYLILTNNDFEEGDPLGGRDYDNDLAWIPTASEGDDDLAQITLKQLHSSLTDGTFKIELSDPTSVRLFDHNGNVLYDPDTSDPEDLQFDLADPLSPPTDPAEYLSGLLGHDVDIWLEGLHTAPDFTVKIAYLDANDVEVARDTVHMTLAEWTFRDHPADHEVHFVESPSSGSLQVLADQPGFFDTGKFDGAAYFRVHVDAVAPATVTNIEGSIDGNSGGTNTYTDEVQSTDSGVRSTRFASLYSGTQLPPADKTKLRDAFGLNVLNANFGVVKLITAVDEQQREVEAPQLQVTVLDDFVQAGGNARIRLNVLNPRPNFDYRLAANLTATDAYDPATLQLQDGTEATFDLPAGNAQGLRRIIVGVGQLDDQSRYVGVSEIAAAVVSNAQFNSQYHRDTWDALHIDGIVPAYAALGLPLSHLRMLNNKISDLYRNFYNTRPDVYKWAGMSAWASSSAGNNATIFYMIDWYLELTKLQVNGRDPVSPEILYRFLTDLNFAIYFDAYPQHLAFSQGGLAAVQQMNPDLISQTQLTGWTRIQEGINAQDPAKIIEGNALLLRHEQEVTAQAFYEKPEVKALFGFLSDHATLRGTLQSPIPDDQLTFRDVVQVGHNGGAPNLAEFEDRWQWIDTPDIGMLAKWQSWSQQHNSISAEELGVSMDENQLIIQMKLKVRDLWNVFGAFPDLLAWQAPAN